MEQIFYTSIASSKVNGGDVFDIISDASARNRQREITGVLTFVSGCFFQAIEGPTSSLDSLLASLKRDPRHHSMQIVRRWSVSERQFPDWHMHRLSVDDVESATERFRALLSHHPDSEDILQSFRDLVRP